MYIPVLRYGLRFVLFGGLLETVVVEARLKDRVKSGILSGLRREAHVCGRQGPFSSPCDGK